MGISARDHRSALPALASLFLFSLFYWATWGPHCWNACSLCFCEIIKKGQGKQWRRSEKWSHETRKQCNLIPARFFCHGLTWYYMQIFKWTCLLKQPIKFLLIIFRLHTLSYFILILEILHSLAFVTFELLKKRF